MKKTNKPNTKYHFPVLIEKDEDGVYVGTISTLRSCYTQAKTLPTLYKRLEEAARLCIESERALNATRLQ